MKTFYFFTFCLISTFALNGQTTYFPPTDSEEWEQVAPEDLGWCNDQVDSLLHFLEENNTKAFIVLKDGRIAIEAYFDSFGRDSLWYWASAGKTLAGFLVGLAQEEGFLNIDDPVQDYLGTGWTALSTAQEEQIKIVHQLNMTSGLDDGVDDPDCLEPECLQYLTEPGSRWAYHNAPYRLVQDVVANASGLTFNQFTNTRLKTKIGMKGLWFNYIYFSTARDAARFGLLLEQEGDWNGEAVLADKSYLTAMTNTSQDLNLSYGFLTWLNGKASHLLPTLSFVFNEPLLADAPADLYAGLGKNDQKIHVVPSQDLVVVRLGNASNLPLFALSPFDNELWVKLNQVMCNTTSVSQQSQATEIKIFPNPVNDQFHLSGDLTKISQVRIYNSYGQLILEEKELDRPIDLSKQQSGIYFLQMLDEGARLMDQRKIILMK